MDSRKTGRNHSDRATEPLKADRVQQPAPFLEEGRAVPGWQLNFQGHLVRQFTFDHFVSARNFAEAAWAIGLTEGYDLEAERQGTEVEVRLLLTSEGLTERIRELAERLARVAERL